MVSGSVRHVDVCAPLRYEVEHGLRHRDLLVAVRTEQLRSAGAMSRSLNRVSVVKDDVERTKRVDTIRAPLPKRTTLLRLSNASRAMQPFVVA